MYPRGEKKMNKKRNYHGSRFHNRGAQKKEYMHQVQLTETDVGITEFISDLEGFSGIIKARYSDFQVNEISLDGKVAKLTDMSAPSDFIPKLKQFDYENTKASPLEQLPQEKWDAIKSLITSDSNEVVNLEADNFNKEDRTLVHKCIKNHFGQKIVASTVTVEDKKYMQFKKYDKEEKLDIRNQWPEDKGEYVHFVVYKEALDTMDVCLKIGNCLRISPSRFTYAGVKDKRAKTTQWFCAHKVEPWKFMKKTRSLWNVKVGNFTFKDTPLKLGQLQGNKFRIALRNVTGSDELINQSMKQIKENGFINYYGLQRFGNDKEVPTFKIGNTLLLGKWKEAAELILKPKGSDDRFSDISKAKKVYLETGKAEQALELLEDSRNVCVEARLLHGLMKSNDNDYVNALENIPRNMRLLYLHSFQSLIWNRMVSKRLQVFGMKPVEGDLVFVNSNKEEDKVENTTVDVQEDIDEKEDEENVTCKQEVRPITADEISNYTIYDIVLPLPGYDVTYPDNLKQFYKDALEEYGLTLEMPKQRVKTYTLCGNYRKILGRINEFSWKIVHYNDPTDNLIRSDFEELKGQPEPEDVKDGKYKAVLLEFDLTPASYATMVLREILKMDTSSSAQARLNDYHDVKEVDKKIILESSVGEDNPKPEACEIMQTSSLLLDTEKYEEFKNSVFNVGSPTKRKSDGDQSDSKKIKIDNVE